MPNTAAVWGILRRDANQHSASSIPDYCNRQPLCRPPSQINYFSADIVISFDKIMTKNLNGLTRLAI